MCEREREREREREKGFQLISSPCLCRYRLRPRVLRDVSNVDMRACLLGEEVAFPIGVSPTALQQVAHSDGELATARGVAS